MTSLQLNKKNQLIQVVRGLLLWLATSFLGASLIVAFAPFQWTVLAILIPAGLLALITSYPQWAGRLGFAFGLGFFGAGTYWLFISMHQFGQLSTELAISLVCGLVVILACFPAIVCYGTTRYYASCSHTKLFLAFPALWVASEWARSWLGDGFPWLFIGYSQTLSPLKNYAPLLSVYGVSLVTLVMSGCLVHAVQHFKRKHYSAAWLSLLAMGLLYGGGILLNYYAWTKPARSPLTVSLVQGNIPQSIKWVPSAVSLSFERYLQLSQPYWQNSDLLIWPEAALPVPLQAIPHFIETMNTAAKQHHLHLILGIPVNNPAGTGYYNTMIALGQTNAVYQKRRLVPFGEYIPFATWGSRLLDFLHVPLPDLQAGHFQQPDFMIDHLMIQPSICFEIGFPELMRLQSTQAGLLISLTNDAWFGHSIAQALHLQMASMRAIELGRPLLLASNDGLTAIIAPTGRITAIAPAYTAAVLHGTVQPMAGRTPWMHYGIDLVLVLLMGFLLLARAQKPLFQISEF